MSPANRGEKIAGACFPRVSGDEPWGPVRVLAMLTFSPRERG